MSELPTILFTCEACGIQGRVPESFRGKTARCPSCKHVQIIPMDAPSPPASGATQRIAQPTITRSFANPAKGEVSDETRGRALLGIIERLEKIEGLHDRLQGSMQRLQTRSSAGDEDVIERITQLQNNLNQTQHAVTALHHMETRIEALAKKIEVLQRSNARLEHDRQMEELFEQLKRLQRQVDSGPVSKALSRKAEAPDQAENHQHAALAPLVQALDERLSALEAQTPAVVPDASGPDAEVSERLQSLQQDLLALREEHEERLNDLLLHVNEFAEREALPAAEGDDEGEGDGEGDQARGKPLDAGDSDWQAALASLGEELETLRQTVASLPEASAAGAESAESAERSPPASAAPSTARPSTALAILAIILSLAAAGFAAWVMLSQQQLVSENASLQARLDEHQQRLDEQQAGLTQLAEQSTALDSQLSATATAQQDLNTALRSEISALEGQLGDIGSELQGLNQLSQSSQQRIEAATTQAADLDQRLAALGTQVSELDQALSNLSGDETAAQLRSRIDTMRGQLTALSTKLDATSMQVLQLLGSGDGP